MNQIIKNKVLENKNELLSILERLIQSKSISSGEKDGFPHGKEVAETLDLALSICDEYHFETKNIDYEAGYAQIGQGEKLIGILAHLDVVPPGEGWDSDPFMMKRVGNKLFGRGVMDDKGPVAANIIALKIVQELRPNLSSRVRLIMGCDEERGSSCLAHYVKKEGHIDMGYTPDGDFPLVFGEKGIFHFDIAFNTKFKNAYGGEVYNAAISKFMVEVENIDFNINKMQEFLSQYNLKADIDHNKITLIGVATHASTPEKGINAASYLMEALYVAGCKDEAVLKYNEYIEMSYLGENLGINHEDKYGVLTLNVGKVRVENGKFIVSCDIRYPITTNAEKFEARMIEVTEDLDFKLVAHSKSLFVDPNSPMIELMLKAYRDVTNDFTPPLTIGGGTYARGINNCVAFGAMNLNKEYNIHNINEEIEIEDLLVMTEVYIHALLNMIDYFEGGSHE